MRVLVAPDKFKGTLTARQAAEAIVTGVRRTAPDAALEAIPMADGGEGTLESLVAGLGGSLHGARVNGPLGDPVDAEFGIVPGIDGERLTGVVEMARASGLALIGPGRRAPLRTTTLGTGELILAAADRGAARILVCIGGSATNDGGAGMAQALGVRLLDSQGREIPPGGAALLGLSRIDATGLDRRVRDIGFVVATDVDNPLTGPLGASAVYGPQKGATPEDVVQLDQALAHFAAVIHRDLGIDVRAIPGAGAAGGLGAGLVAFLGARIRPGVEVVMDAVRLRERLGGARLVVTGEGRFDPQSMHGKVPSGVLRAAAEFGVPAVLLCGAAEAPPPPGVVLATLAERFGEEQALARPAELLVRLAEDVVGGVLEHLGRRTGGEAEHGAGR